MRHRIGKWCAVVAMLAVLALAPPLSAAAKPVEILFWHPYGPPWSDVFQKIADDFNASHPDIHLTMQYQAGSMPQNLIKAVAGGVGPDLAHVWGIAPIFGLADEGAILPLDQPLASVPDWKVGDIFPPFLDAYRYRGQLWALPMAAQPDSLIWNKSVFANSGLDPESAPKDQSAFEAAIEKINRFDADHRLQIAGYVPGMWGGFMHWAYDWGGNFYDAKSKKITATDPVNVESLQWLVDLYKEYGGVGGYNAWKGGVHGDPLWLGKAGMQWYEHYQYYSMHLAAPKDFSWGFAPVPVMGPADAQPKGNVVHTDANVMVATTKHPHEAAIALQWVTDGLGSLVMTQVSGHPSSNVAMDRYALEHNLVPDWYPRALWLQNYDVLMRARPWPQIPVLDDLTSALDQAQNDAIAGKAPAQTLLQTVNDTIQPKLDEALARLDKAN